MNFWVKIYILSNYQLKYKSEVTLCLMFIVYRSIIKSNRIFKEKNLHMLGFKQLIHPWFYGQFKLEHKRDFISSIITVTLKK